LTATIFSNIEKLHLDTTNQTLRTSISQDLQNCQQLIDKNKAIARFVFTNLSAYQETAKATTPQILAAKKTLVADDDALLKVASEGAEAARDIAKFHGHIATLKVKQAVSVWGCLADGGLIVVHGLHSPRTSIRSGYLELN
jgi:hypothetical protein